MNRLNVLRGHTSPETAFLVNDYPYGFRLRCKIRYWIETTKQGQRFCSQTTNPKKPAEVWNAPKKSTYSDIKALYLDEKGHVQSLGFSIMYNGEKELAEFFEKMPEELTEYEKNQVKRFRAILETRKHITVSIRPASLDPAEEKRRDEEQAEIKKSIGRLYAMNCLKEGVQP